MKKSFRSTLILLAVFIALVAWFQIYEKRVKPKQAEADEKTKQLVTLSKDDIQEIDITRLKVQPPDDAPPGTEPPSKETSKIVLKLTGKDWNVAEPVQDGADGGTVNTMISSITTTKHERVVDEKPTDLGQYGLKTPRFTITVRKGGAATSETLKIGGNTPTGFSSYVQVGDSPKVYRVPRSLRTSFDKQVKEVRNKSIVNWTRADITEVEIQNKKENIVLKRPNPDKEEWDLARDHVPADTTEWNKTLNAILEVKAVDFPSEDGKDLAKYGLSSPLARIQFTKGKENKKLAIRVGKVGEKVYLTRDDRKIVYEVDKDLLNKIETKSEQYRSLRLANFNRFDVKRIKLERGPKDIVELLKEEKTGWGLATDPTAKLNATKVDSLLTQLQDIKLTRYLTPGSPKMTSPLLTIRVFEKKGTEEKEQVSLLFSKPQGKLVTVNRSDLDIGFLVKEEDFAKLNLSAKDFIQAPEVKTEPKKDDHSGHDHGHSEPEKS